MKFIESLLLTLFAHKATKEVVEVFENKAQGSTFYQNLRKRYYGYNELPLSVLSELSYIEPDLFDRSNGSDHRDFLNLKFSKYKIGEAMYFSEAWFTISANFRFIAAGNLDDLITDNLREEALDDFSKKPFNPSCNPKDRSITICKYTFYFDHPFFYNFTLLVLSDSDQRYYAGERIQQRSITLPKVKMDDTLLRQYGLTLEEVASESIILENAYCATLNDFNSEKWHLTHKGQLTLRRTSTGISVLSSGVNGNQNEDATYLWFLSSAESVNIRGCVEQKELYICRTSDGWGGMKFKVSSNRDYYMLAGWLVVTIAPFCEIINGWDADESIREYWPTYPPLVAKKENEIKRDAEFEIEIKKKVIFDEENNHLKIDFAHSIIVSWLSTMHHKSDCPSEKDFEFYMPVFSQFRSTALSLGVEETIRAFQKNGMYYDKTDLEIYENIVALFTELFMAILGASNMTDKQKKIIITDLIEQIDTKVEPLVYPISPTKDIKSFVKQYLGKANAMENGDIYIAGLLELLHFICDKVITSLKSSYPDVFCETTALRIVDCWIQDLNS